MGKRNKVKIKWRGSWKEEVKNHKTVFVVYVVLRLLIIGVAVASFISGNYQNVLLCALSLVLFMLPTFVSKNFGINFPETLEIIILLFIFAAEILGEISAFYHAPYGDGLSCRRYRLCACGRAQQKHPIQIYAEPRLYGGGGILLFHDGRVSLGVF